MSAEKPTWLGLFGSAPGIDLTGDDEATYTREDVARAWDEGHKKRQRRGPDTCTCSAWSESECGCGRYGTGELISLRDNPYRGVDQ